jgi:DNA-binding NtrC family response regulator
MARILLAEDDEALRDALVLFLESVGHEVVAFPDGRGVLAALDAGPADMVITDLRMPVVDGLEVLSRLRERESKVPVLVISGTGLLPSDMLFDRAHELGAAASLEKPFDLADIHSAVDRCLGGPSQAAD